MLNDSIQIDIVPQDCGYTDSVVYNFNSGFSILYKRDRDKKTYLEGSKKQEISIMGILKLLISCFLISFVIISCVNNSSSRNETIQNEKKVFNCVVDYLNNNTLDDVPYTINPTLYELVDTSLLRGQILHRLDSMFTSEDLDAMINQYEKKKIDWVKKYLDPEYYGKIDTKHDERNMIIFSPPLIKDENIAVVVVAIREFVLKNEYAADDVIYICVKSNDDWKVKMTALMR